MKRTAVFSPGALLYFAEQNEGGQNPVHSYTNCASVNDLVMLLCCIQLTYQIHHGVSLGATFNLIPNHIGFCHGQKLIGTATYSFIFNYLKVSLYTENRKTCNVVFRPCLNHNVNYEPSGFSSYM